ncbi:alpha/beta fold hydrolase [Herbiconiux sp.]|uniref:alpha/beta fold hydrolase n=1 Tax=Herbiconiux sp. TaxID=1871186 RepID=UPI0025BBAA50|nr:alpha/beta fold hydrolase [Herbiconiux sp.]
MKPSTVERLALSGGTLRLITAGDGPALVYLHGTGDQGSLLPVFATLAEQYRIVRPDHPGFLQSDDFRPAITSIAEIAAVHEQLLDELGIDEFVLVGCSLGGWVAAELALRIPHRVRRLVLIDPVGLAGDGSAPNLFDLTSEQALVATVHDEGRRAAARSAAPDPQVAAGLARSRAAAQRLAGDPYMHDPSLAGRLGSLALPVELVWGDDDGIVPVSYARFWLDALPQAHLTVVPDAGHLPHVEQPQAVRDVLTREAPAWS